MNSEDAIRKKCERYDICDYTINDDGSIDVNGVVDLTFYSLKKIPLKFRSVNGSFNCSYNSLTSLEGSPKFVSGNFYANYNDLITLDDLPNEIIGKLSFIIDCNIPMDNIIEKLSTLKIGEIGDIKDVNRLIRKYNLQKLIK